MNWKRLARNVVPPIAWEFARRALRPLSKSGDGFHFAPDGWRTQLPSGRELDAPHFVARERRDWDFMMSQDLERGALVFFSRGPAAAHAQKIAEHGEWLAYAYALALAARGREALRVLDYGGGLGYFFPVGEAVLPDVRLEYHCKDLPGIVAEGRKVNPRVVWHSDDACLDESYDLVILAAVLPYIADWRALLRRAARAVRGYFFLMVVPTVERAPGYVAIQRVHGAAALYGVMNRGEVLATIEGEGLTLVREFLLDEHPAIPGAPEQPQQRGWLFRRAEALE